MSNVGADVIGLKSCGYSNDEIRKSLTDRKIRCLEFIDYIYSIPPGSRNTQTSEKLARLLSEKADLEYHLGDL